VILFPAADIRGGRLVRLREGKPGEEFSYEQTPRAWVEGLVAGGASFVHVIDLGAAFGEPPSLETVREVVAAAGVPAQVGGGIRTVDRVRELLEAGARRLIMSTRALEDAAFLRTAVRAAGADRIVVALDFRGGRVGIRGWQEERDVDLASLGRSLRELGLGVLLVTAIERDGTFEGPDVGLWRRVAAETGMAVVGAGGIGSLDDLRRVRAQRFTALEGVVTGRALVEGRFSLGDALAAIEGPDPA
jgi:phosphoribosylformimino-5-aminoimidazole carboxamide ribotide isomerase